MFRIAAKDSHPDDKAISDLVCDGTNDLTVLQKAFGRDNDKIVLSEGVYHADKGSNGIDGNPYIYPGKGTNIVGEKSPVIEAKDRICRIMMQEPNVYLQDLVTMGYVHIQNYESNQTLKRITMSNTFNDRKFLDWRKKGGCTGMIQNWVPPGKTMSGITISGCALGYSYHHGIGFHINGADEGATFKDITVEYTTIDHPGSGFEGDGKSDWSTGIDVDTGDINGMMVRNVTVNDSWQSAFHTDGSWENHSQKIRNLTFENCIAINAGRRCNGLSTERYEAGFYLQDALLKGCSTQNCRVGYLIGNENANGFSMKDCSDTGSDYSLVVEYGGNGINVDGFTSTGANTRALQMCGRDVSYTNFKIVDFKGKKAPINVGTTQKLIYVDAPSHKKDLKRYDDITYKVTGRFDIVSPYTQVADLIEVHKGSSFDMSRVTLSNLNSFRTEPLPEVPLTD